MPTPLHQQAAALAAGGHDHWIETLDDGYKLSGN